MAELVGLGVACNALQLFQAACNVIGHTYSYLDQSGSLKGFRQELVYLRDVLGHLAELENGGNDEGRPALFEKLKQPMADCAKLLAKIEKATTQPVGTLKKIGKAIKWPLTSDKLAKHTEKIRIHHQTFLLELQIYNTSVAADTRGIVRTMANMDSSQERATILAWYAVTNPWSNHNVARGKHTENTGEWFLQDPQFMNWRDNGNGFYWIFGMPGCGKTILSSSVIHHLQETVSSYEQALHVDPARLVSERIGMAFFYFDFQGQGKQTLTNFLSSVVAQLCQKLDPLPDEVEQLHSICKSSGRDQPTIADLLKLIKNISGYFKTIYIVTDALDECSSRDKMFSTFRGLVDGNPCIRLLATSRDEHDLRSWITNMATATLGLAHTNLTSDIRTYVQHSIENDSVMSRWPRDSKETARRILVEKAQGMFRWVACQLVTLRECLDPVSMLEMLNTLPDTLDETYKRILVNINSAHRNRAVVVLTWLAHAKRPLNVAEITEVLASNLTEEGCTFDPERRVFDAHLLTRICPGLIALPVSVASDVRLSHFSVLEYLESRYTMEGPLSLRSFHLTRKRSDEVIAGFCLSYLNEVAKHRSSLKTSRIMKSADGWTEDELRAAHQAFPLFHYCLHYWFAHASPLKVHKAELSANIMTFLKHSRISRYTSFDVTDWAQCMRLFKPDGSTEQAKANWCNHAEFDESSPLYLASLFGLHPELLTILKTKDLNGLNDGKIDKALRAAASGFENLDVVETLLKNGANPSASGGEDGNALFTAVTHGRPEIIQMMVDHGANPNVSDVPANDSLHKAVWSRWAEKREQTVEVLLQSRADPHADELGCRGTAFESVGCVGSEEERMSMLRLFMEYGAHLTATLEETKSGLHSAAIHGYYDLVQCYLEDVIPNIPPAPKTIRVNKRAKIPIPKVDAQHIYAVACATFGGCATVYMLTQSVLFGVMFAIACLGGYLSYQYLPQLRVGKATPEPASQNYTILEEGFYAKEMKRHDQRPREHSYTPEEFPTNGVKMKDWLPLHHAIIGSHPKVIKLLASKENSAEGRELAEVALRILNMSKGLDTTKLEPQNLRDRLGWTTIHIAALLGKGKIVRTMVNQGADVNMRDAGGMTSLHWVVWCASLEMVKLLVFLGANCDAEDNWGRRPIDLATSKKDRDTILEILRCNRSSWKTENWLSNEAPNFCPWRVCNGCLKSTVGFIFYLHCKDCEDYDLCGLCALKTGGCPNPHHEGGLWMDRNGISSPIPGYPTLRQLQAKYGATDPLSAQIDVQITWKADDIAGKITVTEVEEVEAEEAPPRYTP